VDIKPPKFCSIVFYYLIILKQLEPSYGFYFLNLHSKTAIFYRINWQYKQGKFENYSLKTQLSELAIFIWGQAFLMALFTRTKMRPVRLAISLKKEWK
jgi:hypothetical protein